MKIVIHTQYYPPEMGAPQTRLSDLASRLKFLGHEVQVLTAMPNYPTGHLFPGYKHHLYLKEKRDGIRIYRSFIFPSNRPSLLHRLISYLSFCLSSFVFGLLHSKSADVIITETPPLFLGFAGWLLATLTRAHWVLNVSDLWPESAKHVNMLKESGLTYKVLEALSKFLFRRAWLVTGQSLEIINHIRTQVPGVPTFHLSNGVDMQVFHPSCRKEAVRRNYLKDGEVGFVYAGLHGFFQGLEQIIWLAENMQDSRVRFILFGDGPQKDQLMQSAQKLGLTNLDFNPPLPHKEMPTILASMDVAVIPLKTRILGAVPSKIYEAMAAGIPILLIAEGEAKEIVEGAGAGLAVSPGSFKLLLEAAQRLAGTPELRQDLGQRGRVAAGRYDKGEAVGSFEAELCRRVAISKAKGPQERTLNRLEREGVTILRVEDGFLYASHNYKILLSANGGDQWEIDGIISVRRWRKMVETFPFLNRTTRGGVFNVLPLPDGARLGVVSGWLVRAESHSTWYRPVLRLARGSRPLNLCMAPNGVIYFGEYFLNLRRSQPVNVVASRDGGKRWEVVYTFPQGSICHIHRIFHDPYDNALLVCTGDRDQEVGIYKTNDDFKTLESLAQGNQDCRTTALIPFRDYFLYGTDNPNGANFIMALDRRTRKVEKLQEVPGPVLYGCQVGGKAAFSTMQENKKHQVTVWVGSGRDFRQVAWFQTNNSTRLWRELVGYSTVVLPEGRQEGPFLYCTPLGDLTHSNTLMRIPL